MSRILEYAAGATLFALIMLGFILGCVQIRLHYEHARMVAEKIDSCITCEDLREEEKP